LFVLQKLVGVLPPLFAPVTHLFGNSPFAEVQLLVARLTHNDRLVPSSR
jgi:hypothetical protein